MDSLQWTAVAIARKQHRRSRQGAQAFVTEVLNSVSAHLVTLRAATIQAYSALQLRELDNGRDGRVHLLEALIHVGCQA